MQKFIATLYLASLTACTSPYGNYAALPDTANVQMADDTAHELTALYPPASTHLSVLQTARDAYGTELIKQLHEAGYAVQNESGEAADPDSMRISYTLDHLGDELNRLTLSIGTGSLSRVYNTANDNVTPAGSWTRKE